MLDPDPKVLIAGLRAYCLGKPGVEESLSCGDEHPDYLVVRGSGFTDFAKLRLDEAPELVLVRCTDAALRSLGEQTGGRVRKSERMRWETQGWTWAQAPLDGSIPEDELRRLVDASYSMVYDTLDEYGRAFIALRDSRPAMEDAFETLLDLHRLGHRRDEILALRKPAIRLVTSVTPQESLAAAQSRIGGVPDLPESWSWPAFEGRPMAFLAQLNLAEIPADVRLDPLPSAGVLYVFSMLGRQKEDGDLDEHSCCGDADDPAVTQVRHYDGDLARLTRQPRPPGIRTFPTAALSYQAKWSLPSTSEYTRDPSTRGLSWPAEELDRMFELAGDLDYLYSRHVGSRADHLLFGYAGSIQSPVTRPGERLLLQIDSDDALEMMWGDGGTLYFVLTDSALAERRFSEVRSEEQCG